MGYYGTMVLGLLGLLGFLGLLELKRFSVSLMERPSNVLHLHLLPRFTWVEFDKPLCQEVKQVQKCLEETSVELAHRSLLQYVENFHFSLSSSRALCMQEIIETKGCLECAPFLLQSTREPRSV